MVCAVGQEENQYKTINALAEKAYEKGEKGLDVDVSFFGKRSDPSRRGSIRTIDRENFTPSSLVIGVLRGMCNELYELYECFGITKKNIVASGGGVRKNDVLKRLIADRFGASVSVNTVNEEAAMGAALFAGFVSGKVIYNDGFSEYINYM